MANGIKIGNLDISAFKVGSSDCKVYLGDTLLYPTTPGFQGKWLATYSGGTTSSAECDTTSAITSGEITKTNLVSIEIGDCVTSIGENAFMNCGSLTSITIPDSVTTIGNTAFLNDSSITSIDIPSGVTNIGEGAFLNCGGLTGITVNATTPPTLGNISFANTNNCPIYVPTELVATYKSSWSGYASRIQAIPTPTLQWVTFTNEFPPHDESGMVQIYGIRFNSLDVDNQMKEIQILNEVTETSATIVGAGRGRVNFNSWDGCNLTSSSNEDIEMDFTNGYIDDCGNLTEPPYYLDCWASAALEYITYQVLIYQ